ncbi:YciI family protein [Nocardioides sp.]|uniref:YciI family protein n=1 Tax=Nocardioides sp. TaxID=35761 RepID=UPI002B270744|nr:YciI family protein [Nocardioides sp.]
MSQYFLAVNHGPADVARMAQLSPSEMQEIFTAVDAFNTDLQDQGAWVFAGGLQPAEMSTVVDNTGSEPIVTDGPYAESKEYLGGFWVIEAADLDAALAWATKGSRACAGKVEVRPFQDEPEA